MTRSASRIVPVILALCAAGSAAALEHEFAFAPLVVGAEPGSTPEYHVDLEASLQSKVTDDYRVVHDDAALGLDGVFRAYGLGVGLETDWSLGQAQDVSRPGSFTSPGQLQRFELNIDYAIELRDPRDTSIPLLQIIPHFTWITYPHQRSYDAPGYRNYLKGKQRWFGADAWLALPIEGVEVGAGLEQNISSEWRATRGGVGGREFIQYNSLDIALWQKLNFADSEYRNTIGGKDSSGLTTLAAGARITTPVFVQDVYAFVETEASFWLSQEIRNNFRNGGQDGGDFVISVGLDYKPQ
jgi:hypothetical protein